MTRRASSRAFTLVELLVVIVILGILIAIAVPSFIGTRNKAYDSQAQSSVTVAQHNAKALWVDEESYQSANFLGAKLRLSEPGLSFKTTSTFSGEGPKTIFVDVTDAGHTVLLCAESQSGRWFCLTENAEGALQTSFDDSSDATVLTATRAVARSWGLSLSDALCHLPSAGTAPRTDCQSGSTNWSEASGEPDGEAQSEVAPTVSITSHPQNPNLYGIFASSFAWTTDGTVTLTECSVDEGEFVACPGGATSYPSDSLALGPHTFTVRVSGPDGTNSADYSWVMGVAPNPNSSPSLSGSPYVGETLSVSSISWSGYPTPSITYQWQRKNGANWQDIDGATGQSYLIVSGDVGHQLKVEITGTNTAGSGGVEAGPTAAINALPNLQITSAPSGTQNTRAAIISFGPAPGSGPISGYGCSVDGGASYSSCSAPFAFTAAIGANDVRVRATGPSGATDNETATWTVNDYQSAVLASSPKIYWRFNNTDLTDWDISGNGNHGYRRGAFAGVNQGMTESAVADSSPYAWSDSFNGGIYHNIMPWSSNTGNIGGTHTFSAEIWFKPTVINNVHALFFNGDSTYGEAFALYVMPTGALHWVSTRNGNRLGGVTSDGTVQVNHGYHAAMTYDGATIKVYLNGVLVASEPATENIQHAWEVLVGTNYGGTYGFSGYLDEFAVYNTALSAATVAAHYSYRKSSW